MCLEFTYVIDGYASDLMSMRRSVPHTILEFSSDKTGYWSCPRSTTLKLYPSVNTYSFIQPFSH